MSESAGTSLALGVMVGLMIGIVVTAAAGYYVHKRVQSKLQDKSDARMRALEAGRLSTADGLGFKLPSEMSEGLQRKSTNPFISEKVKVTETMSTGSGVYRKDSTPSTPGSVTITKQGPYSEADLMANHRMSNYRFSAAAAQGQRGMRGSNAGSEMRMAESMVISESDEMYLNQQQQQQPYDRQSHVPQQPQQAIVRESMNEDDDDEPLARRSMMFNQGMVVTNGPASTYSSESNMPGMIREDMDGETAANTAINASSMYSAQPIQVYGGGQQPTYGMQQGPPNEPLPPVPQESMPVAEPEKPAAPAAEPSRPVNPMDALAAPRKSMYPSTEGPGVNREAKEKMSNDLSTYYASSNSKSASSQNRLSKLFALNSPRRTMGPQDDAPSTAMLASQFGQPQKPKPAAATISSSNSMGTTEYSEKRKSNNRLSRIFGNNRNSFYEADKINTVNPSSQQKIKSSAPATPSPTSTANQIPPSQATKDNRTSVSLNVNDYGYLMSIMS